jgi:ribonuclease P protein component
LSGPKAFARVFTEGKRREGRYTQLIIAASSSPDEGCADGRAGMVVSRKALPRAVDRNRFKRKVRETLRALRKIEDASAHSSSLSRSDVVIRVKPALSRAEIDVAAAEVSRLLQAWTGTGAAK